MDSTTAKTDSTPAIPKVGLSKTDRLFSCVGFWLLEGILPLTPFILILLKSGAASIEVLLITTVMYIIAIVNTLKNPAGVFLGFFLFFGLFTAWFVQDPNLSTSVHLASFNDFESICLNAANTVPFACIWLVFGMLCYTLMLAIRTHGDRISPPHWTLPFLKDLVSPRKYEENE